MSDYFHAGEAAIWAQPDGPNTAPVYLGCHELGEVAMPEGDMTPRFCPDAAKTGSYRLRRIVRGAPGVPTVEITLPIGKTLDVMESWKCLGNLFVNKQSCGRRDLWTNFDRTFIFRGAESTAKNYANLASRTPENQEDSMATIPLAFVELQHALTLDVLRQSNAAAENLLVVAFLREERCVGSCGPAISLGQYGVVGGAGDVAAKAMLFVTTNGGATWTAAAADPFAVAEDIGAAVYFAMSNATNRIIVARSTTDAGNPPEIGYSDTNGAAWTLVTLGATNADFVTSMFALDRNNIWAGTDLGYIYKSVDAGATWTAQESGVLTANPYWDIYFLDANFGYAVSDANVLVYTVNGGTTWSAMTMPAAKAAVALKKVFAISQYEIWAFYNDGDLFYTMDGGTNWYERSLPVTTGVPAGLWFVSDTLGYLAGDAYVLRTRDGGYSWEIIEGPHADDYKFMAVTDDNEFFLAGIVSGTTGQIWKAIAV
jgi:photosystem II stability/assembly factor-like uncharacterized protein